MNNSNHIDWSAPPWKEFNEAVLLEINKVRVTQKVFETATIPGDPLQIADEVINFADLSIAEGVIKPFVELCK